MYGIYYIKIGTAVQITIRYSENIISELKIINIPDKIDK
jgi:hypothetical protein